MTHRSVDLKPQGPTRGGFAGGFTLVELLVVVAVVGILVALVLPAVQSAREAARRTQCVSQVKQISLALLSHHDTHNHFPYGGWGSNWGGVPGRGSGPDQPGSWIYSILPEVEEEALHQLGIGTTGEEAKRLYSQRVQTPLPLFNCPTRGRIGLWPTTFDPLNINRTPKPFAEVTTMARSDYAINGGVVLFSSAMGPENLEEPGVSTYWDSYGNQSERHGVSQLRWGARLRQIVDGTSKTYLVGEKFVYVEQYFDGSCAGDNESMYNGYGMDMHRHPGCLASVIGKSERRVCVPPMRPRRDTEEPRRGVLATSGFTFGSPHAAGTVMSKCDGSVEVVPYDIDWLVYLQTGHRSDLGHDWDAQELGDL